jgi:predicted DNA-binding helix-hairpin-helix protein
MTNACSFDCSYCFNRCNSRRIYSYTPEELARVFNQLYSSGQVDGLFLSSGSGADADATMRQMIDAVKLVRGPYRFKGYVHLKILPGVGKDSIKEAARYADRLSINIEAPTKQHLAKLSTTKDFDRDIVKRQEWIKEAKPRAGQTTQMVVGACEETDLEILKAADGWYEDLGLRRVYYSAFTPLKGTPLEGREPESANRLRRLYNADFLMREYGIPFKEIGGIMQGGYLPPGDPKALLALERFGKPIDINEAEFEDLIRIPGIGLKTAYMFDFLKELKPRQKTKARKLIPKKALPFLKIDGHSQKRL